MTYTLTIKIEADHMSAALKRVWALVGHVAGLVYLLRADEAEDIEAGIVPAARRYDWELIERMHEEAMAGRPEGAKNVP